MVTVSARVRQVRNVLAPAELRVVEVLMHDYPMAGAGPIGQIAAAAQVSAPTVLRLVRKLGFDGYAEFRVALQEELKARLFSPVGQLAGSVRPTRGVAGQLHDAHQRFADGLTTTFRNLDGEAFAAAVRLVSDASRPIMFMGGRFSWPLASQAASLLQMLRVDVLEIQPAAGPRTKALLDVGPKTVVFIVDYRRYQASTVEWAIRAQERGATLVVLTDPFLSPIAPRADVVLTSSVGGPPPFDAMTSGFAVVEALCSCAAAAIGKSAQTRLALFERLQGDDETDRAVGH